MASRAETFRSRIAAARATPPIPFISEVIAVASPAAVTASTAPAAAAITARRVGSSICPSWPPPCPRRNTPS